jgi:integrase
VRGLYDLRHTYATFALRAGVPVFAVSRFIGSSIEMIDRHYGHLARDSREHAVALLDALALERAVHRLRPLGSINAPYPRARGSG